MNGIRKKKGPRERGLFYANSLLARLGSDLVAGKSWRGLWQFLDWSQMRQTTGISRRND
ncbi:hypothetical protein SynPROS91_01293 [Synechococcus sp. PROS-9-1]|nr:hypothetical protein SynPROS91_01293 [Synechococcus sp. PROS-9-1]